MNFKSGNHKIINYQNMQKTIRYLHKNGLKHTFYAAKERIEEKKKSSYAYEPPKRQDLEQQKKEGHRFAYRFSIVVPAYETKETFLRELIDSVRAQSYEDWELIIADASAGTQVEAIVTAYQEKERGVEIRGQAGRIRYLRLRENRGISENTNEGIMVAEGDYIGLLDHDDTLAPDALYEMATAIYEAEQNGKTSVLLYSDEDKMETEMESGATYHYLSPNKKNKFNFDLILSNNYICHFMVAKASLMKKLKLRKEYDGAQDYDFVLRVIDELLGSVPIQELGDWILHIPKVLYHWRCHELSTAGNTASKTYAYDAGKAALEDFHKRRGYKAQVRHSLHLGFYQTLYLPGIFEARRDIGIIGGRILDGRNRIKSGIYDEKGMRLYQGLHREYSGGATHLAVLMQDCRAVDIRCMRLRKELRPTFEQITGIAYQEIGKWKIADVSGISCDEEGYRKLSMELGDAASKLGYLVAWNPQITIKERRNAK